MTIPTLQDPISQLCTQSQFDEDVFGRWIPYFSDKKVYHRKHWEFVFIARSLEVHDKLVSGNRGLGFGIGKETLPAVLASKGIFVTATDLPSDKTVWSASNQHVRSKDDISRGWVDEEVFQRYVEFLPADMREIPEDLKNQSYDFVWSCSSMEHLGSPDAGFKFLEDTIKCLKPGGISVHTTEYNLKSNTKTLESGDVVIYRERDLVYLSDKMFSLGAKMKLNLERGNGPYDLLEDRQPYRNEPHIALHFGDFTITSIGIVLRKDN
jgi:2-polyprenyl-3-methyl-5-hydroxy-6-metoxy-1,4-benzoquinol methylase